jgi:hypothetical protein
MSRQGRALPKGRGPANQSTNLDQVMEAVKKGAGDKSSFVPSGLNRPQNADESGL